MGSRLNNPITGRFLATDSVYDGNANPYTNPTDPINKSEKESPPQVRRRMRILEHQRPDLQPVGAESPSHQPSECLMTRGYGGLASGPTQLGEGARLGPWGFCLIYRHSGRPESRTTTQQVTSVGITTQRAGRPLSRLKRGRGLTYPGTIVVGLLAVALGLLASVLLDRWHWSLLIPAAFVFLAPLCRVWWSNRPEHASRSE